MGQLVQGVVLHFAGATFGIDHGDLPAPVVVAHGGGAAQGINDGVAHAACVVAHVGDIAAHIGGALSVSVGGYAVADAAGIGHLLAGDRKSTRLDSSHLVISYARFCLDKS